jgi:hypothetical protein
MALIDIILYLVLVGVLLWLLNAFVPMAPAIKSVINAVVTILVIIWLLKVFGIISGLRLRAATISAP